MGLPMYLTVALIVASVIISGFIIGINKMITDSQVHHIETELSRIISDARNMYEYADEGTLVMVHVDFPGSLRFIVFGSTPLPGYTEPSNLVVDKDKQNSYYYVLSDGTVKVYHSNVRFSGEDTDEFALFHAGSYDLYLELVKEDGASYVKVYTKK